MVWVQYVKYEIFGSTACNYNYSAIISVSHSAAVRLLQHCGCTIPRPKTKMQPEEPSGVDSASAEPES